MNATARRSSARAAAPLAALLALSLPASGCSILFSVAGSAVPSGPAYVRPIPLRAVGQIGSGERLRVTTVDGDTVIGAFVALDETPAARYAVRVREWRERHPGAPVWPEIGESVRVRRAGASAPDGLIEGRFGGFGHLGLRITQPRRTLSLGYADVDSLVGAHASVAGDSLAAWDARFGLPSFSVLRLDARGRSGYASLQGDDGGSTTRVVLTASAVVSRWNRPTHARTGLAVGVIADMLALVWFQAYVSAMR